MRPNIDFWSGEPKQATYFELYDHTVKTLKAVNPKLRVGGPSTAAADWVTPFLDHVTKENIPIDFVSTHGYADDTVENLFHTKEEIPLQQRVCRAIGKVHGEIKASAKPDLPLMWTEWNVPSFGDEYKARDTTYVGAALADDIRQCDGLVDILSYWTFDDVFEENGVVRQPFYGGFGTIAAGGIKKPSFYAYALLHKLGEERLANDANILVTRRKGGTLVIAMWNAVDPDKKGAPETVTLRFNNIGSGSNATIHRVDATHGNVLTAYQAMGSPRYPTQKQITDLNHASELGPPQKTKLQNGEIRLEVPVNGLVVMEVGN